jgi:transposase InsO family protein
VKYAAIANWAKKDNWPIAFMCTQLGVSRSGYYKWRTAPTSKRVLIDDYLTGLINQIYQNHNRPGVRRVAAELRVGGYHLSNKRVWRLMRAAGLKGRTPKAFKKTTTPDATATPAPDRVGRRFNPASINMIWCGDITYIKTFEGWAYMATVIDLYSRKLIGWAIAHNMTTSLVEDALKMAIKHRNPKRWAVTFHSDRGSQYTSTDFTKLCHRNGIHQSMGRTGNCFDNAVAESFFATYKKELIHTRPWPTINHLKKATFKWIEQHYNTHRRHSTLGYLTPTEYELGYRNINQLTA